MMSNNTGFLAAAIFCLVYLLILAGENSPRKLDRPAAGFIGALLMVLSGVLTRREAAAAIDLSTLGLLLGMMMVIHYASVSGLIDKLALTLLSKSRNPVQLLWMVCAASGVLSALFVNDTICLLMTPLLVTIIRRSRLPAEPYFIALATSSNVGSVMTLTGSPQNMLIGQSSHWSWSAFALRMIPIGLICLLINSLIVLFIYRKELTGIEFSIKMEEEPLEFQRRLAFRTLFTLASLLIAFLLGAPMDVAALSAAVFLMIWANRPSEETFSSVDWSLLLFFASLFIVVEGFTKAEGGALTRLTSFLTSGGGTFPALFHFSLVSVIGSNLFSNVPFVMLVRGKLIHLPGASLLWLMLSASSTFAGNLTLLGSVANLIVAQGAREECTLGFKSFLKVGVLTTLLTTLAAILILWIYGRLGWAGT